MKQQLETEILVYLKQNRLKFSSYLEDLFYTDYVNKSLKNIRIAILVALVLYMAFGVLDFYFITTSKVLIWLIRFGIVSPILALILLSTYYSIFTKFVQFFLSLTAISAGYGIIAIIAIVDNKNGSMSYYAGLILVIMWSYTYVRLRFLYASIVSWTIVIGYDIVAIFIQNVFDSPVLLKSFISNNFFIVAASIIGMFVCYFIEVYARKDFLHRLLIIEKQKDLELERNRLRVRNDIMINDLNMARNIQQQLIPLTTPTNKIATFFKPMEPVGGDFYDFIEFREHDWIGIFISDVSGHGASAALITSMIKSFLAKSHTLRDNPALLLYHLNESLINHTGGNFITAFYCIYNPQDNELVYSNAGHNYPYIITDNEIMLLQKGASIPLAILDNHELFETDKEYTNTVIQLPVKGKLLLYTDGLTEAARDFNHKYQFKSNIEKVIKDNRHKKCNDFIDSLYIKLVDFCGSKNFSDDICVICVDIG